ncbi:uncharacterized protein CcaverHIS019_0209660 [Cutaneotrichosporon cavernicola]|uniref:BHLH domain-containing protein n=1 Tax=Cutaneotrichosporon cavernicola TaxID=279322 RepID=A0AA48I1R2_9TREE|nr:uncharacterized protein CcaverHIS019_0209660 [Cutaneotrichosporon cavernicola]BEI89604.1 hypothetical protein CcaverHIS019_0209660 [Cutaneotrichosporon cavernicola]
MEGFQPSPASNDSPTRPVLNRPFSDGSMTVDSSILSSLMNPVQSFSFGPGSMSNQAPFDYNMVSPQQQVIDLPGGTSPHSFQPHAMFGHLNFGAENREPPILSSSLDNNNSGLNLETTNRSRSQSSSRSSHFGKAPVPRSRTGRKLSMNETKPNLSSIRGRTMQPPRSMSFQTDTKPNLINLGPRHNSITSAEYSFEPQYGISIPRNDFGRTLWGPSGSAPSGMDSLPPFGTSADGTAPLESPMTPAQSVQALLGDESRKQRRRECHNQVEKRRREHINAMIEELNKLLPPRFKNPLDPDVAIEDDEDDENGPESPVKKKKSKRAASTSKQQKDAAQCKGRILSDSVQYIRDLQNVTSQQSSRIKYLESLISQGAMSGGPLDGPSHNAYTSDTLEAMGASPEEPERLVSVNQAGWNNFNSATNMLVFEPSPTDASSGPEAHRSTPLSSGSPETDSKDGVVWAGLMELAEETSHPRKNSQAELQSSMSNMDLDVGMDDRRGWAF